MYLPDHDLEFLDFGRDSGTDGLQELQGQSWASGQQPWIHSGWIGGGGAVMVQERHGALMESESGQ